MFFFLWTDVLGARPNLRKKKEEIHEHPDEPGRIERWRFQQDYFNVFEHERVVKRKKGKCFVNGPFFNVEKFCECFGEIEHDELPSIDDEGDEE